MHEAEKKIEARGVGDPEAAYKIAQAYGALGDKPSALRVLARSIDNGFFPYPYLVADPLLDSLRAEPQFAKLMRIAGQRHESFKQNFS